ncbi:MAG: PepSY-like domain-containing protein [Bacteroidota bacterium]
MKKIFLMLIAMLLISGFSYSQKVTADKVPAEVKTAFQKMFPTATKVAYEMEKADYEISFMLDGTECSANFDKTGKWLETETELNDAQIPAAVKATLAKEFEGYKTKESVKLETPETAAVYEFDVAKGESLFEVQIARDGKLLKKQAVTEEDEEKD